MLDRVHNRKLKLALLGSLVTGAVVFINHAFGVDVSVEEALLVITPILSYIGAEGVADVVGRYKQGGTTDLLGETVQTDEEDDYEGAYVNQMGFHLPKKKKPKPYARPSA